MIISTVWRQVEYLCHKKTHCDDFFLDFFIKFHPYFTCNRNIFWTNRFLFQVFPFFYQKPAMPRYFKPCIHIKDKCQTEQSKDYITRNGQTVARRLLAKLYEMQVILLTLTAKKLSHEWVTITSGLIQQNRILVQINGISFKDCIAPLWKEYEVQKIVILQKLLTLDISVLTKVRWYIARLRGWT